MKRREEIEDEFDRVIQLFRDFRSQNKHEHTVRMAEKLLTLAWVLDKAPETWSPSSPSFHEKTESFRCVFSNADYMCALARNETISNTCQCVGDVSDRKRCPFWALVEALRK